MRLKMLQTRPIVYLMMLSLASCVPNGSVPTNDFCSQAHAIYTNKADKISPDTAREILAYNNYGEVLCGWSPVSR